MKKMGKTDRLKELEKIAEKLGIGQNREVKCVACRRKIKFRDAVILTNKKKVTYLCKGCNEKLEKGELDKEQIETNEILKEIEKLRKRPHVQPVPYEPKPIPWSPYEPDKWRTGYEIDVTDKRDYLSSSFKVFVSKTVPEGTILLKFEPDYGDKTSSNTQNST